MPLSPPQVPSKALANSFGVGSAESELLGTRLPIGLAVWCWVIGLQVSLIPLWDVDFLPVT